VEILRKITAGGSAITGNTQRKKEPKPNKAKKKGKGETLRAGGFTRGGEGISKNCGERREEILSFSRKPEIKRGEEEYQGGEGKGTQGLGGV